MCRDQACDELRHLWEGRLSHCHEVEDNEQLESNLVVLLIAGLVEGEEYLVCQASLAANRW
jgi:hypothetical protein